ncbi:hypothetical protein [Mycolicibacterium arenosum]|uniref:Glutamyl-tRNA reductase n=1 Tax=Mycolicibacterium arenosum TaxID=2952157 RepID=A0ABT1LZS8_9MYCO|nr:hypothetical protein [Mycolicibacterium sp. CAU 1645]MCP9271682.1 hypothetical protein [Mycolicibacterium sp. CAU 1645]
MTDLSGLAKHPATTLSLGAAATAIGLAAEGYRACERLPFVGDRLRGARSALERRGEEVLAAGLEPLTAAITAIAVELVDRVLDELDLNALVRERVDLIGLADEVVAGINLPAIIRESTGSVTSDVMHDVRSQSERADDAVAGIVDRILRRDKGLR